MSETKKPHANKWSNPFIRWAGSKRGLIPMLSYLLPKKIDQYIEPFVGSGCLFFAIKPNKAILGDINQELITTYEVVKNHPRLVSRALGSIPSTDINYQFMRTLQPQNLDKFSIAIRFLYLNRYCFNGVYRTNKKGEFNVPRGTRTGSFPSESEFYRCSIALRATSFMVGDFENCLTNICKNDFVYLDPPYATATRKDRGEYGPGSFQAIDMYRLYESLVKIESSGARFMLSYCETEELINLLPSHWKIHNINVRRHMAGFSRNRQVVNEIIVTNYMT